MQSTKTIERSASSNICHHNGSAMSPLAALTLRTFPWPVMRGTIVGPSASSSLAIIDPPSLTGRLSEDLEACQSTSLVALGLTITMEDALGNFWGNVSQWFIKRTFQPSVIRKRRKQGFLTRRKSYGGRRILKRRLLQGRKRLGGC